MSEAFNNIKAIRNILEKNPIENDTDKLQEIDEVPPSNDIGDIYPELYSLRKSPIY